MRKNYRTTKHMTQMASNMVHFGAVLGVLFVMVIINILASSSCQQLSKTIGEHEKEIERLDDAIRQESTRWEQMKTPEKLNAALLRHGLKMLPAHPDQLVRMKGDGTPYPCMAVNKANRRRLPTAMLNRSARRKGR